MAVEHEDLILTDVSAWRAWLDEYEEASDGVWLRLAKKGVTQPTSLTYEPALEEALCSGWIDGQMRGVDAATFRQRFTPRRKRSIWSVRNVERIARLAAEGRLRPRGLAEVERAQADGRWAAAYEGPAKIEVPAELAAALAASPAAAAAFETLTSQNRYAILHRVVTCRTDEARQRNIAKYVEMLERGETPYPQSAGRRKNS